MRRYLEWAGWLLCGVSLLFVFYTGWTQRAAFGSWRPDAVTLALMVTSMLVVLAGMYVLSGNWRRLLCLYVPEPVEPAMLRSVYARSNLGKYLPGNVAHLAARHVLGRASGLGHAPLALSTLLELAGLAVAAFSVGVLAGALDKHLPPVFGPWLLTCLVLLAVAGYVAAPWLLAHFAPRTAPLPRPGAAAVMTVLYLRYVVFFLLGGAALLLLAGQFVEALAPPALFTVPAAFAAAFFLGLVTPGAPSGLGVREAVIVLALEGLMPPAEAVVLALLFRLVTVGADVLLLLVTMLEMRRQQPAPAPGGER